MSLSDRKYKRMPMKEIGELAFHIQKPKKDVDYKLKAAYAEPTGKGDLLIIEGFFGRMFRSDEGCVRDELDEFSRKYHEICQRYDDDPAHEYYEVMSYDELFYLHGLIPAVGPTGWGYTNTPDYRVSSIDFDVYLVTEGEWVDKLGEKYLYYCPKEYCTPDPCYLEV